MLGVQITRIYLTFCHRNRVMRDSLYESLNSEADAKAEAELTEKKNQVNKNLRY
jgi:hypothetical protein